MVVSGVYSLDGDALRLAAEIVDARSGRLLANVEPVAGAAASPTAAVATLAERVTAAMSARVDQPTAILTGSSPPTLEAFRAYQEGLDAFSRGDWRGSIVHYQRAIAIDSTFPPLVLWASVAHGNLGLWAAADTLLLSIRDMVDRLTPLERVHYEWQRAIVDGHPEGRLRWAEEGFRLNPTSWAFPLALVLVRENQPRRALSVLRQFDRDSPFARNWFGRWLEEGQARHMLGDYRGEQKTAARWRGSGPARLHHLMMDIRALAGRGRVDEVRRLLEHSLSLPPERPGGGRMTAPRVAVSTAAGLRAHGHRDAAVAALDRLLGDAPVALTNQDDIRWVADALYLAERWDEARAVYGSLHRAYPDNVHYVGGLGVTHARLGEHERAAAIDSILASRPQWDAPHGGLTRWRARIAAALGDTERAVRLLQQARAGGMAIGFFVHAEMAFESLVEHPAFRELDEPTR